MNPKIIDKAFTFRPRGKSSSSNSVVDNSQRALVCQANNMLNVLDMLDDSVMLNEQNSISYYSLCYRALNLLDNILSKDKSPCDDVAIVLAYAIRAQVLKKINEQEQAIQDWFAANNRMKQITEDIRPYISHVLVSTYMRFGLTNSDIPFDAIEIHFKASRTVQKEVKTWDEEAQNEANARAKAHARAKLSPVLEQIPFKHATLFCKMVLKSLSSKGHHVSGTHSSNPSPANAAQNQTPITLFQTSTLTHDSSVTVTEQSEVRKSKSDKTPVCQS